MPRAPKSRATGSFRASRARPPNCYGNGLKRERAPTGGIPTLIADDIGGTKTRLALVSPDAGPRNFVAEEEFQSADYKGLLPILEAFLAKAGRNATSACFDVAGPVIGGRAHLTNLAWDLEETALFGRRNHEQETGFHERLKTTESEGTE